jgi:NAD+ synthase
LKDYATKAGVKGFVIGVSGGVDSGVVSTLCAKTGLEVLLLEMPIRQKQDQVNKLKSISKTLKKNSQM